MYRNHKLLKSARDQLCVMCGSMGSTTSAHCNELAFRGMGLKSHDCLVAWLCQDCHDLVDGRTGYLTLEEKREMWRTAFIRTVIRWFEQSIIEVT